MDAQTKYQYWLDRAHYDLDTATTMLNGRRWLYVVFMCQQAIEKLTKGLYVLYMDDTIPRVHNIRAIIEKFEDKLPLGIPEETYEFFDTLSSYYLNNRYPDYMEDLTAQIKEVEAKEVLERTKETFAWLLTLKK
ncbi:MAG: HEPN domain-containing protein [Coriobacteriales bacterium]|jgi:HEPN domain-containing protein|nr:HEPN domain-containing protein [Coriobacteriales bacterium]